MIAIVFLAIFLVAFLASAAIYVFGTNDDAKVAGIAGAVVSFLAGLIVFIVASVSVVPARTVGIVTEFGKAVGTVEAGFHWLTPWSEVTEFPTTLQALDLDATDSNPENPGKVAQVAFSGGGTGFVNINIIWHVSNSDKAVDLWNSWRDFGKVEKMVVEPAALTNIGVVVGAYAPQDARASENYTPIGEAIELQLGADLDKYGIKIENVAVKRIDVDGVAQGRIDANTVAQENTKIAKQDQETAKINAETDKIRQSSLTPGALRAKCLEITAAWDTVKNGPLPANWNCSGEGLPLTMPAR